MKASNAPKKFPKADHIKSSTRLQASRKYTAFRVFSRAAPPQYITQWTTLASPQLLAPVVTWPYLNYTTRYCTDVSDTVCRLRRSTNLFAVSKQPASDSSVTLRCLCFKNTTLVLPRTGLNSSMSRQQLAAGLDKISPSTTIWQLSRQNLTLYCLCSSPNQGLTEPISWGHPKIFPNNKAKSFISGTLTDRTALPLGTSSAAASPLTTSQLARRLSIPRMRAQENKQSHHYE